ncbi:MAG: hypothetical protein BGP12_00790 [Rhodospirillales bacterium 70-18]|nr:MAG: hypothetical protein BGP12_00790 [Rhodospirillales bacterium 70-18]
MGRNGKPPAGRIVRGLLLLATFRAAGLAEFAATRQAFLNSFAPLIAFPLVGGLLMLGSGGGLTALGDLLATAVALLAPPVLSHAFAVAWKREALWLRYAVAFNWCQWAVPLAAIPVLVGVGVLIQGGMPTGTAVPLAMLLLAGYGLALQWFLARRGLDLPRWRATLLVLAMNVATGLLVIGPRLLLASLIAGGG